MNCYYYMCLLTTSATTSPHTIQKHHYQCRQQHQYSVFMQIGLRCCQYHFNHRIKVACIHFFLKDENIHSVIYHNYLFCFMGINVHTFRIVLNEKLAFTVIII